MSGRRAIALVARREIRERLRSKTFLASTLLILALVGGSAALERFANPEIRDTIVTAFQPGLVILMHDGPIDSAAGAAVEAALPQVIDQARRSGFCFGLLNAAGMVRPAKLRGSHAAIPEVINPVPYLPLESYSGGQLPPDPYVIIDPASQL